MNAEGGREECEGGDGKGGVEIEKNKLGKERKEDKEGDGEEEEEMELDNAGNEKSKVSLSSYYH